MPPKILPARPTTGVVHKISATRPRRPPKPYKPPSTKATDDSETRDFTFKDTGSNNAASSTNAARSEDKADNRTLLESIAGSWFDVKDRVLPSFANRTQNAALRKINEFLYRRNRQLRGGTGGSMLPTLPESSWCYYDISYPLKGVYRVGDIVSVT